MQPFTGYTEPIRLHPVYPFSHSLELAADLATEPPGFVTGKQRCSRATQCFEFLKGIADAATAGDEVRVTSKTV